MQIQFQLTKRLAELAGFSRTEIEWGPESTEREPTLGQALGEMARRFSSTQARDLVEEGALHPSILVVVNGMAQGTEDLQTKLDGGETIHLLLPIAGG